jgi:thiamine-phosphate pyrophosphorylase
MADCRLYLPAPAGFSGPLSLVEAALRAGRSPSLLIMGEGDPARIAALASAARRQDAAALLEINVAQAVALDLDGVHLSGNIAALSAARQMLGPEKAIGVEAALSRHEAMTLAEAGADYIAFGRRLAEGETLADLAETIGWWSALFEIPCVVYLAADAPESAWRDCAAAGADFLLPGVEIWQEADRVLETAERLAAFCSAA